MFTTGTLKSGHSYVIEVSAEGFVPTFSQRSHPNDDGTVRLPDLVLRKLRTVTGRVVDAAGKGLSDVVVSQAGDGPARTETRSADDGSFQLRGVPEGFALVFGSSPGYWFRGVRAPVAEGELRIELASRTRPNPKRCDVNKLQSAKNSEQAKLDSADVAALEKEILAQWDAGGRPLTQWAQLAGINEQRAFEILEEAEVPAQQRTWYVQFLVSNEVKTDFENAMARMHEFDSVDDRLTTLIDCMLTAETLTTDQRETLLSDAVLALRSLDNPVQRTRYVESLLPLLHRNDQHTVAQQLVRDSIQILNEADDSETISQQFGALAEVVAKYDPDQAIELQKKSAAIYHAWIAYGIAKDRPAKAAELIRGYKFQGTGGSRLSRWYNLPRVCYRLAQTDVDEALAIAELSRDIVEETVRYKSGGPTEESATSVLGALKMSLGNSDAGIFSKKGDRQTDSVAVLLRARVHALIAQGAASHHPERVRQILEAAADDIENARNGVRNLRDGFYYPRSVFMATLIPAAAELDTGVAAELCWRTLAIRGSSPFCA